MVFKVYFYDNIYIFLLQILKPEKSNKIRSTKSLGPSIILEDVSWQGLGNCASTPQFTNQNFQPVLRNPVDLINATYGQLLSYIVPEVSNIIV